MVGGIANQVDQRIAHFVNNRFIQFSFFAFAHQLNLFFMLFGKIADNARKPVEQRADLHHSHLQNGFAQVFQFFRRGFIILF